MMTAAPSLTARSSDTSPTVRLGGDMDYQTATFFREGLLEEIARGRRPVGLDLSEVSFRDSAGLAVLLWAWRKVKNAGTVLALAGVPAHLQRMFALTGADAVLRMYDTVTAAENHLAVSGST
jgi:anti-sigma B factor antagonist